MADLQSEIPFTRYDPSDQINHDYGIRARKAAQNYEIFRAQNDQDNNNLIRNEDGSSSGYCSPPLWKTGERINYNYLSAEAKSEAVARGQRELMELIKNMPESSYELTLKDLVEQNNNNNISQDEQDDCRSSDALVVKEEEEDAIKKITARRSSSNSNKELHMKKKDSIKRREMRTTSMNNNNQTGVFLKMVLPISFGFGKKKSTNPKATGLVSPKPPLPPNSVVVDGGKRIVDKEEWWKKRFSGSGDSESMGISSNNSGSTGSSGSTSSTISSRESINNRRNSGFGPGCWSFFCIRRNKHKNAK